MKREERFAEAVGRADMCELLGAAFAFPERRVAEALADRRLSADFASCCSDCGIDRAVVASVEGGLRAYAGRDADGLLGEVRREYSLLFLGPGATAPVLPYESAYLHAQRGRKGAPPLFRSASTLDVGRQMREAGMAPRDARREPCDSVFREFSFLSYLYGNLAATAWEENAEGEELISDRIERFLEGHALRWMPSFMERTAELSDGVYGPLAEGASAFFDVIRRPSA